MDPALDPEKMRSDISGKTIYFAGAGVLAGMGLLLTYGFDIPYPKEAPAVKQASMLERRISDARSKLQSFDPDTVLAGAKEYAASRKEYDALMQTPGVRALVKDYEDQQGDHLAKLTGLSFGPVFASLALGMVWKRKKYKQYGL
jgi:hypothetical protein